MRTKHFLLALSVLIGAFGCNNNDDRGNEVNIRLSNNSNVQFKDATFNGQNFGDLEPNEKSDYKKFEMAYHYGAVNITIDGENYGWQPIDFVGETPLKEGSYTFEYSFDTETKILTDKLIKD